MNALEALIREMIGEGGPISLETYMTLALTHPAHGYYSTRIPFGRGGDFVTAPEVSQMFGELIGLWCASLWQAMGAPRPLILAELGPGRGTLMADALRAACAVPEFLAVLDVHLIEASAVMRQSQEEALAKSPAPVTWHRHAEELPDGPALIIANEFFDCLPVRQFVRTRTGWHERLIGLDEKGHLSFGLAPEAALGIDVAGEPGEVLEAGFVAARLMERLAARIAAQGGALLVFDYGYDAPPRGETLQALKGHRFADPLRDPGEADLTAHVNFRALARAARAAGAAVHGPVPQGEWLTRLGIHERAGRLRQKADEQQRAAIASALARLAGGSGKQHQRDMASLFKVLAVAASGLDVPPGFCG